MTEEQETIRPAPEPDAEPDTVTPPEAESDPAATELEAAKIRAEKNLAGWQRAQADFQNHKRRTEQERAEQMRYGAAGVLSQVVSTVDDLERAFGSLPTSLQQLTWVEGIALIYRKLQALLESQGVREIEAGGKQFDPTIHEAIAQTEGPREQIVQVLQRGYYIHDRVLRPALVQVGDGSVPGPDGETPDAPPADDESPSEEEPAT